MENKRWPSRNNVPSLKCDPTAYKYCQEKKDPEFLKKCYINAINGYGVFTEVTLKKGQFICAYFGELISLEEGEKREDIYEENKGSYIFFLEHERLKYCIDATNTECIGKYINDSPMKSANAIIKVIMVDFQPYLCIFAHTTILQDTEIRYDYKAPNLWWRKLKHLLKPFTLGELESDTASESSGILDEVESSDHDEFVNSVEILPTSYLVFSTPPHIIDFCKATSTPKKETTKQSKSEIMNSSSKKRRYPQRNMSKCINYRMPELDLDSSLRDDSGIDDSFLKQILHSSNEESSGEDDRDSDFNIPKYIGTPESESESDVIDVIHNELLSIPNNEFLIRKEEISQLIESKIHSSDDEILSDNNNVIESRHKHGHKKHYCLYCEKLLSKIPRHLEHIHKQEELVIEALRYPKKNKERRNMWTYIERKGDFNVNINNIKSSKKITSVRKCTVNKDDELLPCEYCYGFFRARKLCEHVSKCFRRGSDNKEISYIKASRILVGQSSLTDNAKIVHEHILTTMKHDKLHLVIRNDKLLLTYGAVEVGKKERDRYHDVGYALRVLAKLLLQYRKQFNAEDASAKDLVNTKNYDNIVSSMKVCADYCGPRKIGNPHLVLRIGYSLKTLAIIVKLEYLKLGLQDMVENIRNFLELLESDYSIFLNNARSVYDLRKANAPDMLPEESDIKVLRNYCVSEISKYLNNTILTSNEYIHLCKLTYVRILTFNARRGGEPGKLTLADWDMVEKGRWKRQTDIDALDDPIEKKLAERFKLCYIEGKKKRSGSSVKALVPIIFTEEVVGAIRLLISSRQNANISQKNNYVFARGAGCFKLRGWDALQSLTKKLNLLKPKLITPTRTRKYLATILQLLDMNNAELLWLTNHMGHTKDVHQNWYRREDSTIELTKVAKVLLAMDNGDARRIQNKKIDSLLQNSFEGIGISNVNTGESANVCTYSDEDVGDANSNVLDENTNVIENELINVERKRIQNKRINMHKESKKTWKGWSEEENASLRKAFSIYIARKIPCPLLDVKKIIESIPCLRRRGHKIVKDKLNNIIRKR
ncbi:uncharacterized protein LOC124806446 isoform X3 [Hydra vulgaris]|uniref:uncharacterized protein LOC124806446 isoform X3 n=1 Tax=Hydra vulgaris TaxID=6087 RepID=UPI001F5E5CC5|nr:uncharacterized protein LOC124806446 isoform X4 [Hydra vulgaris]